jgi:hypothetical protein
MADRHRQGQGKSGRRVVAVLGKLPNIEILIDTLSLP